MGSPIDSGDDTISTINITPFVDIILVVLIIFMIATPVIMNPGIKVNLPQAASGDVNTPSQLTLSMTAEGKIFLNGKAVDTEQLTAAVTDMYKKNPNIQAIIAADRNVTHGKVVGLLDRIKTIGVRRFAISTEK